MIDMSPAAVTRRLRRMSELSSLEMPLPSRVDMSPAAVTRRLKEMSELLKAQLRLGSGRARPAEEPGPPTDPAG